MKAQKSLGTEWSDDMLDVSYCILQFAILHATEFVLHWEKILGKEGLVDGRDSYGVTTVIINRKRWALNRLCLVLTGIRKGHQSMSSFFNCIALYLGHNYIYCILNFDLQYKRLGMHGDRHT